MLRSLQTIDSLPSRSRSRRTAPTRTPSVAESMKVVPVRSTTISVTPTSIASSSSCFSSGAVYRSSSPTGEITACVSPSRSVVTSKSMASRGPVSLTRLGGLELLDRLPHDRRARVVGSEREEPLIGGDRTLPVTGLLGDLRQLDLDVRVVGRCLGEALVRSLRAGVRLLRRGVRLRELRGGDRLDGLPDLVIAERLAVAELQRLAERRAAGQVLGPDLGDLSLLLELARLREVEARELAQRVGVLRLQGR